LERFHKETTNDLSETKRSIKVVSKRVQEFHDNFSTEISKIEGRIEALLNEFEKDKKKVEIKIDDVYKNLSTFKQEVIDFTKSKEEKAKNKVTKGMFDDL